jgi:hypothetical protein
MTPLSAKAVEQREREELVTRFFAYTDTSETPQGRFPGYRDRPKKFLYDYLRSANDRAAKDPDVIGSMRAEFERMLEFVSATFRDGFQKSDGGRAVPRVRFEAIAVGSALALRQKPDLIKDPVEVANAMEERQFDRRVVSDGANVRAKLEGRIDLIRSILLDE